MIDDEGVDRELLTLDTLGGMLEGLPVALERFVYGVCVTVTVVILSDVDSPLGAVEEATAVVDLEVLTGPTFIEFGENGVAVALEMHP